MTGDFRQYITGKIQLLRSRFNEKPVPTPLIAIRYNKGVMIISKNTVEMFRKTDVLWNSKIIYGAIGEHQDIEYVVATLAELCNFIDANLSDEDIHLDWLAKKIGRFISITLKTGGLSENFLVVRLVLDDKDSIILVNETGMILPVEHFLPHKTFIILASDVDNERRKIEEFLINKLGNLTWKDLSFKQALKSAKEALEINQQQVFYELVVINKKGSKIYNHAETMKLLNREENNE